MPNEQPADVAELSDGEIRRQRSLFSLLPHDPHADICCLNHADVVTPVPNGTDWLPRVCPKQLHHLRLVRR